MIPAQLRNAITYPIHDVGPDGLCVCGQDNPKKPHAGKHPTIAAYGQLTASVPLPPGAVRYGVQTGKASGVYVVDFDRKNAQDGFSEYERLVLELGPLADAYGDSAGDNSKHLVFGPPGDGLPVPTTCRDGLDLIGDTSTGGGSNIVGPGSVRADGTRREPLNDLPMKPLPAAWANYFRKRSGGGHAGVSKRGTAWEPVSKDDPTYADRLACMRDFYKRAELVPDDGGGNHRNVRVLQNAGPGCGLGKAEAIAEFWETYNPRLEPKDRWDREDPDHLAGLADAWRRASGLYSDTGADVDDVYFVWRFLSLVAEGHPGNRDRRPEINAGDELHKVVDAASAILVADRDMYQRAGSLVQVVPISEIDANKARVVGTPTIRQMGVPELRTRLSRLGRWGKWVVNKETGELECMPTRPSKEIGECVLGLGKWDKVRTLVGITETPLIRPDGSILQKAGYDKTTGYIYAPTMAFPTVPETPTREDATAALADLLEVFEEFPYVGGLDSSQGMVPIAALLTVLARSAILGCVPLFVFEASTAGSGKGLQTDVISLIATGRPVAKTNWAAEEEVRKTLESLARSGSRLFSWDNIRDPFGSPALDAVLTNAGKIKFRVLGLHKDEEHLWIAVMLLTGNNISYLGDTVRRAIVCRLEPAMEDPEARTGWKHDLVPWVTAERGRLVTAALTLLRAYFVAGRPDVEVRPMGSFEPWSRLVASAIVWAGGCDVTKARPARDADPVKDVLRELLEAWPDGCGYTAKGLFEILKGGDIPFKQALRNVVGFVEDTKELGNSLLKHKGRTFALTRGAFKLDNKEKDKSTNTALWRVVPSTA